MPVVTSVTIIDAVVVAAADDRPSNDGSADNSSARHSSTDVPVDMSSSDAAHVAMNANVSSTDASAAAPCISFRKRRCKTEENRASKQKAVPNYFFHDTRLHATR